MSKYYNVSLAEIQDLLKAEKGWRTEQPNNNIKEIVFSYAIPSMPFLVVKVCSGITLDSGNSRGCGKDAIRTFCINTNTNKGWISTYKTYRVQGWRNNLQATVTKVIMEAKNRVKQYQNNSNRPF